MTVANSDMLPKRVGHGDEDAASEVGHSAAHSMTVSTPVAAVPVLVSADGGKVPAKTNADEAPDVVALRVTVPNPAGTLFAMAAAPVETHRPFWNTTGRL